MAKIEIEEAVDHLSHEMRRALTIAFAETLPGVEVDMRQFFRAFKRGIRRKCSTWEEIPDRHITSG